MKIAFIAVLVIGGLFLLITAVKCLKGRAFVARQFQRCNCIVFGKKGTGKDLLFNLAINRRKKSCYANIPYDEKLCEVKQIKDFSVAPNTYSNFLEDKVTIVKKSLEENKDYYISDGGIVLPSQYQGELCKLYPSLPIFYALSRHLTNSNIHINTQNLGRVWDKLREQADGYFKTIYTVKICGLLFTSFIYYDEYESAKANLLPYRDRIFKSKESRANLEEFTATHGLVKKFLVCQRVKSVHYDSRAYHKIIYGCCAPSKIPKYTLKPQQLEKIKKIINKHKK